jgi:ParB family chromosome partitioning protein
MKWARLLYVLAHCAALRVSAAQAKVDRLVHAQSLPRGLSLDMATWFTPTAGNFLGRLTKDGMVEALREARNGAIAPAWLKGQEVRSFDYRRARTAQSSVIFRLRTTQDRAAASKPVAVFTAAGRLVAARPAPPVN